MATGWAQKRPSAGTYPAVHRFFLGSVLCFFGEGAHPGAPYTVAEILKKNPPAGRPGGPGRFGQDSARRLVAGTHLVGKPAAIRGSGPIGSPFAKAGPPFRWLTVAGADFGRPLGITFPASPCWTRPVLAGFA